MAEQAMIEAWASYVMEECIPHETEGADYNRIVRQLRHAFMSGYEAARATLTKGDTDHDDR